MQDNSIIFLVNQPKTGVFFALSWINHSGRGGLGAGGPFLFNAFFPHYPDEKSSLFFKTRLRCHSDKSLLCSLQAELTKSFPVPVHTVIKTFVIPL